MRFVFILVMILSGKVLADTGQNEIGRLFTSPEERQRLDSIRYAINVEPIKIPDKEPPKSKDREIMADQPAINLKGLIYNKNGRNAAWINNSNTLSGYMDEAGIKIETNKITKDKVPVTIKYNEEVIRLKVGDSYDPDDGSDIRSGRK